jgi:hypothetical protein
MNITIVRIPEYYVREKKWSQLKKKFQRFSFSKTRCNQRRNIEIIQCLGNKFLENLHKMERINFNIDSSEKNKDTIGMDGKQI